MPDELPRTIRFGDFQQAVSVRYQTVRYGDLSEGGDGEPGRLEVRAIDVYRLLAPYVGVRLADQLRSVLPLAVYLVLFQVLVLRHVVADGWSITGGVLAVILGLMLFMEGLKLGLMPFGETIGAKLPVRSSLPVVALVAFLLGIGVTFAEPAIGALQRAGSIVEVERAPLLHVLLGRYAPALVLVVGLGVGLAAVLGTLRFLYGWSLKPMIYLTLAPLLLLTVALSFDEELGKVAGLAWDCGAVTTGPVTVPLVLALGIGVASSAGKGGSTLSGFGIVTLASLFPILAVLGLSLYVSQVTTPADIVEAARAASSAAAASTPPAWEQTPLAEIVAGVRAIVPLVVFLAFVLLVVVRDRLQQAGIVAYGLFLAVLGMSVFNVGLTYGLSSLGAQSGSVVPSAFMELPGVPDSPLYGWAVGIGIAFFFAFVLGFGATLAEPALNALGMTVENLTNGAFKKSMLLYAVSFGVACGIGVGVLKIVFSISIVWLIVPLYSLALVLTWLSSEEFVNVAWDSAGVTTGPVTVPLVLSMGVGLGNAADAVEGFGILSMASIFPILSVLATGIHVERKARQDASSPEAAAGATR